MKMKVIQRIRFSSKASTQVKSLKPIFKELGPIYQAYIDKEDPDFPFRYGERPQTGLLSAAVWRRGGVSLEEYGTEKNGNGTKRGRCDLYVRTAAVNFECEVKHIWVKFAKSDDVKSSATYACESVYFKLSQAIKDVRKLRSRKGLGRLALCFVTPFVTQSESSKLHEYLRAWRKQVERAPKWCASIWIGSEEKPAEAHGNLYPGTLLLVSEVK